MMARPGVSILDADTGLTYLLAVADSHIDTLAAREIAPGQSYAHGHRDGAEQAWHELRREVQHVQAMVAAIARGTIIPLIPAG